MLSRLLTGLALVAAIKIAVWWKGIGAFTPPAVLLFSIVDAATTIVMTPWASMGRPLPPRNRALRRALFVAFVSTLSLALVNLGLQAPGIYNGAMDGAEALLLLVFIALPRSFFINPIGGLIVMLIASAAGWAWLRIRLPRARGRTGRGGPARAGAGAGTAAAGRGGRATSAPGGRRPR
jgi:hypothetical protein